MVRCNVKGCLRRPEKDKDHSFFLWPKEEPIRQQWKDFAQYKGSSNSLRICSDHFERRYIKKNTPPKRLLVPNAVPTLLPPDNILKMPKNMPKPPLTNSTAKNLLNPNPFEIEFVPHFDPEAEGTNVEPRNLDQIKQEADVEDIDPLSASSLSQHLTLRDFKSEDSSTGCSSFLNTVCSSSDVIVKTECDESQCDIEGRQYGEDLKLLLPEQRDIVRKLVSNIICRAKMNLLTLEECFKKL